MKVFSISKVLLSLTGTPWLILLSTSIPLYLNNQADFDYQVMVLAPYAYLTLIIVVLASLLFLIATKLEKAQSLGRLLWGYYFLGFFFSAMVALHHLDAYLATKLILTGLAILVIGYLCITLEKKIALPKAADFWALVSAAMILADVSTMYMGEMDKPILFTGYLHSGAGTALENTAPVKTKYEKEPNIYHFVFDEYQSDMFSLSLNEKTTNSLAGFTFFPEATTLSGRTDMSIPSILTGKAYDFGTRQFDYQKSAFNDSNSFVYWLKQKGYETYAYIHPMWGFKLGLFDRVTVHGITKKIDHNVLNKTFLKVWTYSNLPIQLASLLVDQVDIEQLKNQNMLPPTAPFKSYKTAQLMLDHEESFSEANRYTFAHLILPHFPYVLNEDCSYDPERVTATPVSQSKCANKLMIDFINELKDLGRFDDSLIIIQSDHGARFKLNSDRLVSVDEGPLSIPWNTARSRSLLLIKLPGVSDNVALRTSSFEASLLDIAPTINKVLGLNMDDNFSGVDLFSQSDNEQKRVRYYHFYEKKGRGGWTDEMTRYRISNSNLTLEGTVILTNNEPGL
tara:strand:+ start:4659 stop:6356 length:1698 start_codon:yes stop_codon:yes gene_type:complete